MVLANWENKTTNHPNLKFADGTERCEIRVGFLGPACRLTNQDGHYRVLAGRNGQTRRDSCAMGGNVIRCRIVLTEFEIGDAV